MRSRAAIICAFLSVGLAATTMLTGAATNNRSTLVASGRVLDSSGQPVAGLVVTAYLEPTDSQLNAALPGDDLELSPFASTTTAADGTWSLRSAETASLPRDADGTIPVLVWGSDSRGTVMRTIALETRQSGALQATSVDVVADAATGLDVPNAARPAPNDGSLLAATNVAAEGDAAYAAQSSTGLPQLQSRVAEGRFGEPQIEMTMGPAVGVSGPAVSGENVAATSVSAPCPIGAMLMYRLTSGFQDRPVQLANGYSRTKTSNELQYATTSGSSFQVGVTYNGVYAGFSGTEKASSASSSGVTIKGMNNAARAYSLTFRFRKYDIYCQVLGTWAPVQWKASGYYQWRPYLWTGGNSFSTWLPFSCQTRYKASTTASSWWVSREETVTRTAAFSISGGALRATQVFSAGNSVRITYRKLSSDPAASYVLCGNNDIPANASLVREE